MMISPVTRYFLRLFLALMLSAGAPIFAGTLVQFRTFFGDIEVELYDNDKPATVQNFLSYVRTGRYQNEFAHRLVPNFVLQGGGFTVTNRMTTNAAIVAVPAFPPVTNEFAAGRPFSNVYGTIAMAKLGGNTNSATSQWFFNLADNSFLDAPDTNNLFVVFGHVIAGTNVLNIFNQFKYWTAPWPAPPAGTTNLVLYQYYGAPFDNWPLLRPSLADTNFVFVDISLLNVQIAPAANGSREISWNSVSNLTNSIEFTTNFPPQWQLLASTNGNGMPLKVVDSAAGAPSRFYRVRVSY